MPAIKSNKLIPLLAICAFLVVGYVAIKASGDDSNDPAQSPIEALPPKAHAADQVPESASSGFLGGIKDNRKIAAEADADTPNESLKTLTSEVMAARAEMQRVTEENRQLRLQAAQSDQDRNRLKDDLRNELRSELGATATAGGNTPAGEPVASPTNGAGLTPLAQQNATSTATNKPPLLDPSSLVAQFPTGFGFDSLQSGSRNDTTRAGADATSMTMNTPAAPRTVLPMGVRIGKGADGKDTLIRTTAGMTDSTRNPAFGTSSTPASGLAPFNDTGTATAASKRTEAKRYFTIPENATLLGVTAMSAIIGRIPVDGKVTDPMQFKLIIGPENLAANGHFVPRDLSGIILSGIAIGDMNLQCSEGLIQSMTFVFNDGTIQTVSQRSAGATPNPGSGGAGGATSGLASKSKLGYISDRHGNPCIAGNFVTNAPAYLTDTIGLKALSLAGEAAAMAQTTVTNSSGFGGMSSSSTVTGNQGKYILGKTASGATQDVNAWLTKRMGNSFDAIITPAGADIVVNIDQEIPIDKRPDARRLDYGRIDADNRSQSAKGHNHDFD